MSEEEIIEELNSLSPSETAIEGILALYQKEKEKNKEYEENYDKLTRHFIENHISKDKIKQCIEKLEIEKKFYFEKQVIQGRIDLLQALLEERN